MTLLYGVLLCALAAVVGACLMWGAMALFCRRRAKRNEARLNAAVERIETALDEGRGVEGEAIVE